MMCRINVVYVSYKAHTNYLLLVLGSREKKAKKRNVLNLIDFCKNIEK